MRKTIHEYRERKNARKRSDLEQEVYLVDGGVLDFLGGASTAHPPFPVAMPSI